jgi:hypothetical protein
MTKAAVQSSPTTERNAKIKQRHKLEAERKKLSLQLKVLEDQISALDTELIGFLQASSEEQIKITGGLGVKLVSSTVPAVKDWDKLYAWIKRNNAFWMLERRPSVTGYRDVLSSGKTVPGVESFTRVKLGLVS